MITRLNVYNILEYVGVFKSRESFLESFEVKRVISKEEESRVKPFLSEYFIFFII